MQNSPSVTLAPSPVSHQFHVTIATPSGTKSRNSEPMTAKILAEIINHRVPFLFEGSAGVIVTVTAEEKGEN